MTLRDGGWIASFRAVLADHGKYAEQIGQAEQVANLLRSGCISSKLQPSDLAET